MIKDLRALFSAIFFALNTTLLCLVLYIFAIPKICIPLRPFQRFCTRLMTSVGELWIDVNNLEMQLLHRINFRIEGLEGLSREKSYLVSANHQSWVDIVMLQKALNRKIPFLRFFLKKELIYTPLLGLAWWALDFPFMQRYSHSYLRKHPEKRGKDLETTRRSVQKFAGSPISIVNFLEGTRFRPEKKAAQGSKYENLLNPKTGGLAFVIEAMGEQFDSLLDVTIHYPQGPKSLWQLFRGDLDEVLIRVQRLEIPKHFLYKHYQSDNAYRIEFQQWVQQLWQNKDRFLSQQRS